MRKGKFKFTNNQGIEEQVALETLLSQVIDSPIRALERSTKYVEGEVALFKSFSKGFLVCVKAGMTQLTLPLTYSNINADYVNITDGTATFQTRLFKSLASITDVDKKANKESPTFTGTPLAPTPTSDSNNNSIATTAFVQAVLMEGLKNICNNMYPVGSLYWSKVNNDPGKLFGGNWKQIKDTFILAAGDKYTVGSNGGEYEHTLTINEIPAHTHKSTVKASGNHTHQLYSGNNGSRNGSYFSIGQVYPAKSSRVSDPDASGTHTHDITIENAGRSEAHNNMPPYITYYCWERIS